MSAQQRRPCRCLRLARGVAEERHRGCRAFHHLEPSGLQGSGHGSSCCLLTGGAGALADVARTKGGTMRRWSGIAGVVFVVLAFASRAVRGSVPDTDTRDALARFTKFYA